ncbi:Protein of unknown function [Lactobacillus equicursoris DSM 19284 = JCM 14600 = CIP 110162]|nr:Protein of unknown function [Lactobacillus equicursoris DSM 19284 = JCM 14600 = CIP 110162]
MRNRIVFNIYNSATRLVITPSRQCPLKTLRKLMDHEKMLLWYKRKPDELILYELTGQEWRVPWLYIDLFTVN